MLCPDCGTEMEEGCMDNWFCNNCDSKWEMELKKV